MVNTINPQKDPMGMAILDYATTSHSAILNVTSSMFDDDIMPVDYLFRSYEDMPVIEKKALSMCKGKVLDVGAGAGCHSLYLQEKGIDVTAVDISPLSCKAMNHIGIKKTKCANIFNYDGNDKYDTILMLMNGTGIAGKINRLPMLLSILKELLNEDGIVLIDSSDLKYVYENEDGSFDINLNDKYYGEVDYQMIYKKVIGERFDWLYVDFPLLSVAASSTGFNAELVMEGSHYDYLAILKKK